jgi:GGDEF domain-containing protein
METLAVAFWGAFFGTVALLLAASLAAFARSLQRVALMAGLSGVITAAVALAYLGWLPVGAGGAQHRLRALVTVATAVCLALMFLFMHGFLRHRPTARRIEAWTLGAGAAAAGAGWLLAPLPALVLASVVGFGIGAVLLVLSGRNLLRRERLAGAAFSGVVLMMACVAGLTWIALDPAAPWQVHAFSAVCGSAYLVVIAMALWSRYSHLLELSEVMAHGPNYDPVTRMRSHIETGQLVGHVFMRGEDETRPIGVIAVTLANLYALENLHGRAAFNHALYVCAARLRRSVPAHVEMGRLGEDGFLLLVRHGHDMRRLVELARQMRDRLTRPISLSVSRDPADLDAGHPEWRAEVGVGVLHTSTAVRPSQAVSTARAMSRTQNS